MPLHNGMSFHNGLPFQNGMPFQTGMSFPSDVSLHNGMPLPTGMPCQNGMPFQTGIPFPSDIPLHNGMYFLMHQPQKICTAMGPHAVHTFLVPSGFDVLELMAWPDKFLIYDFGIRARV